MPAEIFYGHTFKYHWKFVYSLCQLKWLRCRPKKIKLVNHRKKIKLVASFKICLLNSRSLCCTSTSIHPCPITNNSEINTQSLEIPLKRTEIYSGITGRVTTLRCSPPDQCLPTWQQQGWKASSPAWAAEHPEGWGHRMGFLSESSEQSCRTRNCCFHLYTKGWKSQQVSFTKGKQRNTLDYVWTVWLYTLQKQVIRENYPVLETKQKSALNLVSYPAS